MAGSNVGVVRPYNAVVDVLLGIEVDAAAGLDDGIVGLSFDVPGTGGVREFAAAQQANKVAQICFDCGRRCGAVLGIKVCRRWNGREDLCDIVPVSAGGFDLLPLHAQVVDGVRVGGEVTCGGDSAAVVIQYPGVDFKIRATAQHGRKGAADNLQAVDFINSPQPVSTATTAEVAARNGYCIAIKFGNGHQAFFMGRVLQHIPDIIDRHGADGELLRALDIARTVIQQICFSLAHVPGDQYIAQGIDLCIGISET